jgi:hypothetical protein
MLRTTTFVAAAVASLPLSAWAYVGYDDEIDPNYGWSDTEHPADPDAPAFVWDSISGSGTSISFMAGDVQGPFDIGFDFEFYGVIYDQVYVSLFGLLGFSSLSSTSFAAEFPNAAAPNNMIGSWVNDCDTFTSTGYYETLGAAGSRTFVYEIDCVDIATWQTAQVVLEEGANDIFVYVDYSNPGWNMQSIGIEDATGETGISAFYAPTTLGEYAAIFSPSPEAPHVDVLNEECIVDEGGTIDLMVEVRDRVGGASVLCPTCAIAWDVDGDGAFDDADGATITVSAAGADGPSELTPIVLATDVDGNATERTITIDVRNLPPVFTAEPVTTVLRNTEWTYDPLLVDPCPADLITAVVEERPVGMVVLPGGGLRWTPTIDDIGAHIVRILAVDDDDDDAIEGDGDAVLEFTLNVTGNTPPESPVILEPEQGSVVDTLTPTFIVQTPDDAEGDTLWINYDIDTADTYTTPGHPTGRIAATLGQTRWTLSDDQALVDGARYHWRVHADDGVEPGPAAVGLFSVELSGEDAGPDGDADADADGDGDSDGDGDGDVDEHEGDEPGECTDAADNDRDGLFDCDDPGCAGSAYCENGDADADVDSDVDSEAAEDDGDGCSCRAAGRSGAVSRLLDLLAL